VRVGAAAGSTGAGACSGTGGGCSVGMGGGGANAFGADMLEEKFPDDVWANDDVPSEELADMGVGTTGGGGANGSTDGTGAGAGTLATGGADPNINVGSACVMAYGL